LKAVTEDTKLYDDGKRPLQVAITNYDQAIADLTVAIVADLTRQ